MLRRLVLIAVIAGGFTGAMYTETGCSRNESSPPSRTPPPLGTLLGTVIDAMSGAAVAGASVSVSSGTGGNVTTNAKGKYKVSLEAGSVSVIVLKSGYQTFTTTVTLAPYSVLQLDVKLKPT